MLVLRGYMSIRRYLETQVKADLKRKMVFIGGPRQVGKTTFAMSLQPRDQISYLNWDIDENRSQILKKELTNQPLLVLDELHKYKKWRNYLKGLYDAIKTGSATSRQILVTGSARLDLYRYGGDSLQGRYHYFRMMPFSLGELQGQTGSANDLETLFKFGGFPEPFSLQSEVETRRWSKEYRTRLIREDLRDLEQIQDLGSFELLMNRLPDCVGNPLSVNALREDLQVAHKTAKKWIQVLERLYSIFQIPPFGGPKIRAVKKEQKPYFYDWSVVENEGTRFENMVAVHLLKHVYWLEDSQGLTLELRYFRDTDSREVDFVITEKLKPLFFVECKLSETMISPHLKYLCAKYPKVPAFQIHLRGSKDFQTPEGIRVCPAHVFLRDFT